MHRNIRIRNFRAASIIAGLLYIGFLGPAMISAASTPLVIGGVILGLAVAGVIYKSFKIKE